MTATYVPRGLAASEAELDRAADVSSRIVTITGDVTMTALANEGKINLLGEVGGNAAVAVTLPAATGSGAIYKFVVSVVNTSGYTIQVTTTDIIQGSIVSSIDAADTAVHWESAGTSDTVTLDGTTTGGVTIGDYVEVIDILSGTWAVSGVVYVEWNRGDTV